MTTELEPLVEIDERTKEELRPPCDISWPKTTGKCANVAEYAVAVRCLGACDRTVQRLACPSCLSRPVSRKSFKCRYDGTAPFVILSVERL